MNDDSSSSDSEPTIARRLRSRKWIEATGIDGFLFRSAMKVQGLREKDYDRPIIGICDNTSDFNRCHRHFPTLIEGIKQSILQCGGLPRVFNTMTMGADLAQPLGASFMNRNMLAMEIEQTASLYSMDGIVFLGACDETIPAMLMAAASIDLPAILLPGGPSFSGFWRGRDVGPGVDFHKVIEGVSTGEYTQADVKSLENSLERSPGHCSTMGTASTMATIAEAIGMAPAGSCAIPAVDARRVHMARNVGEYIMQLVEADLRPSHIMTQNAFDNAIRALAAVDGSSAAVMHLLAIAGRLGIDLRLEQFDRISTTTPVVLNLKPSGQYYMNDFFNAGGVPAMLNALGPLIHRDAMTVTGRTLGEEIANAVIDDSRVIGTIDNPFSEPRGISVLFGNIAPDGAIIRTGVASPDLLVHCGRAVVFESRADLDANLYRPDFDVRPGDIIVLRGEGPKGSGMPESGLIVIPDKLLKQGITDMIRITDSRLGGTVKHTAVLHVAPESAAGGPLGLVATGDMISLDVPNRRLHLEVSDEVLAKRADCRVEFPSRNRPARGFAKLVADSVMQANKGCDLEFLAGTTLNAREKYDHGS
ncbi:dihydroxy-acid dehydratase [Pararhizobium sp.]|uniref:dihydroxy-acid dehydratase n=1 Tax=Pararhizobium sp. TaxID=1977563 RepID=UPI002722210B|nr:dihydroxy-acid dehydratase [Pararhizobium sp.]MDO9415542.1 dihydroxy-acid dehydratase [Pararhizobium sp.]